MGARRGVTPIGVVLDTNVVVSALLFASGRLRWLRQSWQQGEIVPIIDKSTAKELLRVLTYPKFRLAEAEREDILAEYLPCCEIAVALEAVTLPPLRDAADKMFLQLALISQAAYLVTGFDPPTSSPNAGLAPLRQV